METNEKLKDWNFTTEEVSNGVYRVFGCDSLGRSVEFTGFDPDSLLTRAKNEAKKIMNGI